MRFWPFGGNYECYGLGCRGGLGVDLAFSRTVQPTTLVAALPTQTTVASRYTALVAPAVQTTQISRTVLAPALPTPTSYVPIVEPLVKTEVRRVAPPVLEPTLPMTVADPSRDATLFSQPDLRPTLITTQQPTTSIAPAAQTTVRTYVEQPPRESAPVDPVLAVKPPRVASATGSGTNYEPAPSEPLPAYSSERIVQYSRSPDTYEPAPQGPSELDKAFEQQNYQGQQPAGAQQDAGVQQVSTSSGGTTAVLAAGAAVLALMLFGGKSGGAV